MSAGCSINFPPHGDIQAKNDFDFRSGEQWSDTDKALLNAKQRPHIVFNRVLTILKAVAGMEINGRHEIQFIPSHNEVTAPNELLSAPRNGWRMAAMARTRRARRSTIAPPAAWAGPRTD